ncbi:MAG: hypothetical protein J0L78_13210 [Planctomycetes bacterium]|nr:hypothetical protein [Planctomycetota bacterium]
MFLVLVVFGLFAGVLALLILARRSAVQRPFGRSAFEILAAFGAVAVATFFVADAATGFRQGLLTHVDRIFAIVPAFVVVCVSALFASRRLSPRQFRILGGSCLLPFPFGPILLALDQQDAVAGNPGVSDGPGQFVGLMLSPIITLGLVGWIALICIVVFAVQKRFDRELNTGDAATISPNREGVGS